MYALAHHVASGAERFLGHSCRIDTENVSLHWTEFIHVDFVLNTMALLIEKRKTRLVSNSDECYRRKCEHKDEKSMNRFYRSL